MMKPEAVAPDRPVTGAGLLPVMPSGGSGSTTFHPSPALLLIVLGLLVLSKR